MKPDRDKPAYSTSGALPTEDGFRFLLRNYAAVEPAKKCDKLGLYRKPLPIAFYHHYDLFCAQYAPAIAILRWYRLEAHEADALISLSVDIGASCLASSRILWILPHKKESRRWRRLLVRVWLAYVYDGKGEIQNGALGRREAEVRLFLFGQY